MALALTEGGRRLYFAATQQIKNNDYLTNVIHAEACEDVYVDGI